MIDFVLQGPGQEPGRFDFNRFTRQRLRFHSRPTRPLDVGGNFGKTETAF